MKMTTARVMNDKPLNLGVTCNISSIDNYIGTTMRMPMLTHEEELDLARRWRENKDADAAHKMVLSHLRLVTSIARTYYGYELPYSDLVQEGNIGLLKAVERYDPSHNVRMSSYATPWIKAEINEYVIKNHRMLKNSTTKAHRKLFFNLRGNLTSWKSMSEAEVFALAEKLEVRVEDVREMEVRLRGHDFSINAPANDGDDDSEYADFTPAYLSTVETEPSQMIARARTISLQTTDLEAALAKLNTRQRDIVEQRYLATDTGGVTLKELAVKYGLSTTRIGQIEAEGIQKLRGFMSGAYKQSI